ncbi:MAG: lytic transglycosylase domain-containing protein [Pseudomonadales bacterium]
MIQPLFVMLLLLAGLLASTRLEAAGYPYQSCFEIASRMHDVPLDVLLAVAAAESAWDPDARSHANAHGIMQIQWPGTARHLGVTRVSELYNPCLNIELGARYLRELLDRNDGDLERALASYNYGPTRIDGVDVLPAGASRYVAAVSGQRERILEGAGAASPASAAAGTNDVMRFDHAARARRYAQTLNDRVRSARFSWAAAGEGYAVSMQVADGGLSFADLTLLRTLGWPGLGAAR